MYATRTGSRERRGGTHRSGEAPVPLYNVKHFTILSNCAEAHAGHEIKVLQGHP